MIRDYEGKIIEVIQGDITDFDGDVIVNAANNHFWMGAGVAGAIRRRGGQQIEEDAKRQGPRPVGDAVITSGGKLKARHVIHAAVMGQDLITDADIIRKATLSSLTLAETKGLESIAFPALGTGVGGFPLSDAAAIMIAVAAGFLKDSSSVKRVTFVLYGREAYDAFAEVLTAKSA